jgi:hypothetical protein
LLGHDPSIEIRVNCFVGEAKFAAQDLTSVLTEPRNSGFWAFWDPLQFDGISWGEDRSVYTVSSVHCHQHVSISQVRVGHHFVSRKTRTSNESGFGQSFAAFKLRL